MRSCSEELIEKRMIDLLHCGQNLNITGGDPLYKIRLNIILTLYSFHILVNILMTSNV